MKAAKISADYADYADLEMTDKSLMAEKIIGREEAQEAHIKSLKTKNWVNGPGKGAEFEKTPNERILNDFKKDENTRFKDETLNASERSEP